ncbi:hypothetical protein LRAMOSA03980 [Lichtheimia ramosa]|uniref:Exportin-7/Ran-binding protein 17 TPR repeats domain-containing protein n=1 Tax=Lichtheimia ramosa TaxID=688394 RepID=A0A077WY24_9FUNG|nr:hypothetical protein LRAMOSA03980 [Lichtheimia ramosa]
MCCWIAASFRDTQLYAIFETTFKTLDNLLRHTIPFDKPGQEDRMRHVTINVLLKCLSYDFAGTSLDEAGEDIGTVQIPSSWRYLFEDDNFIPTLFGAYREFPPPLSAKVMECLVLVASVRKGLFETDNQRSKFVISIMKGIRDVILTSQGMNNVDNYNEFCRLLFRFRSSAPLNEMAEKPDYGEWIELIADFTLKAVQSWKWAPNTATYLLGFWSRIIQSMTYYQKLGEVTAEKMGNISVELTRIYATTNVESVAARIEEMLDDPLDSEEDLVENLVMLGQIARCKYEGSTDVLIAVFDPIAIQYQELVTQITAGVAIPDAFRETMEVVQLKIAWLAYILGAFIGSRPSYMSRIETDAIDGRLIAKVLQLMEVNQALQSHLGEASLNQKLEMAILFFLMQFRKSYISETNVLYPDLAEAFGITDPKMILNVMMTKIIKNLQIWRHNEHVIRKTLQLFNELASGFSAVRNLRKTEAMQIMLQNHMSSEFAFFENEHHQQNRMLYYQVLCKVLFADDHCESDFYAFMRPFEERLEPLEALDSVDAFRQPAVRLMLQDIFRDLRGFIQPIQNRRDYTLFFNWFYPEYMPILLRALEVWVPDPSVANVLLKFFAELVHNKSQRLNFDVSSPNSLLLFRDTSRLITIYGRHALDIAETNEKYACKYKGISICFKMLSRCLSGRYINFGVFWLYQDKAIDEAFHMMFQLMLSIPHHDLMGFPKLASAFAALLDDFSKEQLVTLPTLEPNTFLYIIKACEQGIESNERYVRSHACSAIDHICTFVAHQSDQHHRQRHQQQAPATHWLVSYFGQFPSVLPSLLVTVFNLVLFDDNSDHWALSRPLYVLMLLQKNYAMEYTNLVIQQQLPERQSFVSKALGDLTEAIGWDMSNKDRERFSRNVSAFRRELTLHNVSLVPVSPHDLANTTTTTVTLSSMVSNTSTTVVNNNNGPNNNNNNNTSATVAAY